MAGAGATRTGTSPHDIVRTELCTCALPGEERQGAHRPEIAEMHTSKTPVATQSQPQSDSNRKGKERAPSSQPKPRMWHWGIVRNMCVLCEGKVVCNFLELGQFGSPNSKGVSKGCAWGLFGGNIV